MQLTDSLGRNINYLRLSVTDRCNMRCFYCMPKEGIVKKEHGAMLSYEELLLIAETAVGLGIEKIRITGGEPLVRAGIVGFLAMLAAIPGLRHLALTTNGLLLAEMAADLYKAGVQRLNVSLDSLQPQTFSTITRGGDLQRVLAGLDAAEQAGFPPPKINVVIMRGVNDGEILDFADMTRAATAIRSASSSICRRQGGGLAALLHLRRRNPAADRGTLSPGAGRQGTICRAVTGFPHPRRPRQHRHHHRRVRSLSAANATASGSPPPVRPKDVCFRDAKTDLIPWLRPPDRKGTG